MKTAKEWADEWDFNSPFDNVPMHEFVAAIQRDAVEATLRYVAQQLSDNQRHGACGIVQDIKPEDAMRKEAT